MDTTTGYGVADLVADLRRISAEAADEKEIIRQVRPLAKRMAEDSSGWLSDNHYRCNEDQGFAAHLLHEEPNHELAVFAVSWLPHRGTPPHDHGTWAVVAGVDGDETNINWKRLDDGTKPGYAKIEEFHRVTAGNGDVVSFLPKDIHTVLNETDEVSVSLHIYGRHVNHTDRSQFDPENDTEDKFVVQVD